jgi:hypothetical protein
MRYQDFEDANERHGAFREGSRDDLVTALRLATMEDATERPMRVVCPVVYWA